MKSFTILSFIFMLIGTINGQENLESLLFDLEGVEFKKIATPDNFESAYELRIKQPIDHEDVSKGYFKQKVFLSHRSFNAPNVLVTEGYSRSANRIYELSNLLESNQIQVEHRYFGESIPDEAGFEYLTLEQATADLHRVNELLSKVYSTNWVSTGISKGGQTTIYYRYFYPDDVEASVPYVAPFNLALEEQRIYDFLDNVGTKKCRKALKQVQVKLLENREEVLEKLKWYSKGKGLTFTYLEFEQAFEYAVLEYPFSFWQWGHSCENIPTGRFSIDRAIEHLLEVSGLDFFADGDMEAYESHYYQAGTQMGYYSYDIQEFSGLIESLSGNSNPSAIFSPDHMELKYDSTLSHAVYDWLGTNGNEFIYIYGELDTWSATAVPASDKVDALWFIIDDQDHGGARIKNMSSEDSEVLLKALKHWLEVQK